jgi:hypothetical protein
MVGAYADGVGGQEYRHFHHHRAFVNIELPVPNSRRGT